MCRRWRRLWGARQGRLERHPHARDPAVCCVPSCAVVLACRAVKSGEDGQRGCSDRTMDLSTARVAPVPVWAFVWYEVRRTHEVSRYLLQLDLTSHPPIPFLTLPPPPSFVLPPAQASGRDCPARGGHGRGRTGQVRGLTWRLVDVRLSTILFPTSLLVRQTSVYQPP